MFGGDHALFSELQVRTYSDFHFDDSSEVGVGGRLE